MSQTDTLESITFSMNEDLSGPSPSVIVRGGRFPFPVRLRIGRDAQGRLLVSGIEADWESVRERDGKPIGEPFNITAKSLRQLAGALTEFMRRVAVHEFDDEAVWREFIGPQLGEVAAPYSGVVVGPGRLGHSDEFYREVARGYAAACAEDPEHPYSLLARRLYRSESQARRLTKRAWEMFPEMKPTESGKR